MIEQISLHHHIQKHILQPLMYKSEARFSELKPPRIDTNLFTYHLKQLLSQGLIKKTERLYALSTLGLGYVDRISTETGAVRRQPKIISMLVVQNSEGQVLLQKRTKQPYINSWTLPYGKVHSEDTSILIGGRREALEKLGLNNQTMRHVGDAYIRVHSDETVLSSTVAHIFRFESDEVVEADSIMWVEPLDLRRMRLAPAVEEIVTRTFFGDDHFFAEFDCTWQS